MKTLLKTDFLKKGLILLFIPLLVGLTGEVDNFFASNPSHIKKLKETKRCDRCNLRNAPLNGAALTRARLRGANLRGARLVGANLSGADLSGANLAGARLNGANLRGARMSGANLSHANLGGANLRGADLRSANLQGANLKGANLRGAKGVNSAANMKRLSSTGFTLFEILLVVAIIGLTTALIIPRMDMGQTALLKAQVRDAVAILNHARRSAIIHSRPMVASFSTSSDTQSTPGQWVSRGASLEWGQQEGEDKDNTETVHEIVFYPEGGSSGGEFSIVQDDYKVTIIVNPLTGRVETKFADDENV